MKKSANTSTVSRILLFGWPGVVALLVVVLLYHEVFDIFWKEWNQSNGYYSHGILVPLITVYMIWANRKRVAVCGVTPVWYGVLLILPAIPLYLFGKWTGSGVMLDASLMLTILGSVWSFAGGKIMRILLFPLLYLAFMMPLPGTVLDEATMRIQTQSTHLGAIILNVSGYPSELVGSNEIHSASLPQPLVVGVACSGFKLLISLLTFTAFFVYMIQASALKKIALVVFAFPLSVFINSLRIAMIGYAGIWTGTAEAMHKFHDWSGYLGLVICFLVLFGFAKLIKANKFGVSDDVGSDTPTVLGTELPGVGKFAAPVATLLLMLALGLTVTPLEATAKGVLPKSQISNAFGEWSSQDFMIEDRTAKELKTADLLHRVYTNGDDGRQIELFMEVARDTDAFHNPMMCIPGSGSGITDTKVININVKKPRPLCIHASLLKICDLNGQEGYIIHWYMIGANTFPTTSEVRRYMRMLQMRDMYRTIAMFSQRAKMRDEIKNRQAYWYRFYASAFDTEKSDVAYLKSFVIELLERNKCLGEK